MKNICLTWTILVLTLSPFDARGQLLQGTLGGNVTDASQAAIVGAKVVATDQATGFSRDTGTRSSRAHSLPSPPPGTYTVTVSSARVQTYTRNRGVVAPDSATAGQAARAGRP